MQGFPKPPLLIEFGRIVRINNIGGYTRKEYVQAIIKAIEDARERGRLEFESENPRNDLGFSMDPKIYGMTPAQRRYHYKLR